jgi:hypothetical protein
LAVFFALFFRKNDKDKEAASFIEDDQAALDEDEDYLHSGEVR